MDDPNSSSITIHFGKHRGKQIRDIPSDYLKWLARECDDDEIATAADVEYKFRDLYAEHLWGD